MQSEQFGDRAEGTAPAESGIVSNASWQPTPLKAVAKSPP